MKKILTTVAILGATYGAFAQGIVIFENTLGAGSVTVTGGANANPIQTAAQNPGGATWHLALLYANSADTTVGAVTGANSVAQSSLTEIADYIPTTANADGPGFFGNPANVSVGTAGTTSGLFEVASWLGTATTYQAALAGGASYIGQSVEFISDTGNIAANTPAIGLSGQNGSGWDGNVVMSPVTITPEPSTIALGGLGAAALLLFRRRK